jgi:type VI secretion system protein ImpI
MTEGVIGVLAARGDLKREFRIPVTIVRPTDNNPLKFAARPEQALEQLLRGSDDAYLAAEESIREAFGDVAAHQRALLAGMRAGYEATLRYFDPERLNAQWASVARQTTVLGIGGRPRQWELFRQLYEDLRHERDRSFHRLFGEEFGRAYWEQMRRLGRS